MQDMYTGGQRERERVDEKKGVKKSERKREKRYRE